MQAKQQEETKEDSMIARFDPDNMPLYLALKLKQQSAGFKHKQIRQYVDSVLKEILHEFPKHG